MGLAGGPWDGLVAVVLVPLVATLLASWCGWGLARLALPAALRPHQRALTPLVGVAALMVALYLAASTIWGVAAALPAVLLAAGGANLLAWRRRGPPRWRALRPDGLLWLLLAATYLVGVWPLLARGQIGIIGAGWDAESSLATARYLLHGPVRAIAAAPDNPLRDLVQDPPAIGMTLGFALVQAAVDAVLRGEALVSFAPLLAWFRALGIAALVVWLRATMGLGRGAALLGGALASAGALLLWVSYFNFNNQLAGWPLLWLSLTVPLAAVDAAAGRGWRGWPELLLAAVIVMAQAVAYYAALTLWAPLALAAGALRLLQARHEAPGQLRRVLGAAAALAALGMVAAVPLARDYLAGFAWRYAGQVTSLGVFRFIGADEVLGITAFAPGVAPAPPPWSVPALLLAGGLLLAGLALPRAAGEGAARVRWLAAGAATLAYLAWLQLGQAYPYAFMKGAAYAAAVAYGIIIAGWAAARQRLTGRRRLPLDAALLALLGALLAGQLQVVQRHLQVPGLYAGEVPALLALRQLVPPGATVLLSGDPRLRGPTLGIAAYALDHAVVRGSLRTAYRSYDRPPGVLLPDYALLHAQEDPTARGYGDALWRGGSFALYRRAADVLGRTDDGRLLAAGSAATVALAPPPGTVALDVELAAFAAGEVRLGAQQLMLPAGVSVVTLAAVPPALELAAPATAPLVLRGLTYRSGGDAGVREYPGATVLAVVSRADGLVVQTDAQVRLDRVGPMQLAIDIWDAARGVQYGWYGVSLPPDSAGQLALSLDLRDGAMRGTLDGVELPLGVSFAGLRPGSYLARLQLGAGAAVLATPPPLFQFTVHGDGRIDAVGTYRAQTLVALPPAPDQPLGARLADDATLLGYWPTALRATPGGTLDLLLAWRADRAGSEERSVLLHLLDAGGTRVAQFDGPPGAGATPTATWRADTRILDARRLAIPPDLPPGDYTLLVGMYRWPSLDRVPLRVDGQRPAGDVVRLPVVIAATAPSSVAAPARLPYNDP